MDRTLSGFRAALLLGWVALSAAGIVFARGKGIPLAAALPVLAAYLIEYPFYLLAGMAGMRARVARSLLPELLLVSALAPYAVYAMGTGNFSWVALAQVASLALAISLWYVVLPAAAWADVGLLALAGAVILGHYFERIYITPYPGVEVGLLGHLTLIHMLALALLVGRGVEDPGYGFWPRAREWRTGALYFALFVPVGYPLAMLLEVVHRAPPAPWWKFGATFLGILWVVALSEEFLFRGMLQRWLTRWTGNRWAALAIASLLFGAAHLSFRAFPNWRFAAVAAVAGVFYGLAYERTGSIRASMVAHALTVTVWRGFFA
jgi:membrane protease YdiL (CAAX protease family)